MIVLKSYYINICTGQTDRQTDRKTGKLQLILLLVLLLTTQELTQDVTARNEIIHLLGSRTTLLNDLAQPLKLLSSVFLVLAQLLRHLDVVRGVLVLQTLDGLLDLAHQVREAARGDELAHKLVQTRDGTSLGVQLAAIQTVRAGLVIQEGDKGGFRTRALVVFGFLGTLGEELDRREPGDTLLLRQELGVLSLSVHLGDHNRGFEHEVIGEGFPRGSQALAVYSHISIIIIIPL